MFNPMRKLDRRAMLHRSGTHLGAVALASLLDRESRGASTARGVVSHHRPRVKRVVQLFMAGAASHVDTFDYKPLLLKKHGQPWDPGEHVELFQSEPGACLASPWQFRPYGQSGKYLSEIVAPLGSVVDDIAFIHNLSLIHI